MTTRICNRCNQEKSLDEFNKAGGDKEHGKHSFCRNCHAEVNIAHNSGRMWVNGKYIPKTHPLHKSGRYKSFDDVWSHTDIDTRSTEGEVYIIANKAFPNWYKVGKAVSAEDRLNGYQTSSPFRDYELLYKVEFDNRHQSEAAVHRELRDLLLTEQCRGEWFNTTQAEIEEVINNVKSREKQLDLFAAA